MDIYLKIAPGGPGTAVEARPAVGLGPSRARLHLREGGRGVSAGAGPFTWYRSLRRLRR